MQYTGKVMDQVYRMWEFANGRADSRTEFMGIADLMSYLTNDQFEQFQVWVEEGKLRQENEIHVVGWRAHGIYRASAQQHEGTVRIRNPHNPRAWKITSGPWIMRFRDGYDRQLAGHKSLIVREVVAIERGDTLDIPLACSNAYFVAGAQADVPGEERDQLQPGAYAFQVGRIFMSTDDSAEAALPTGATTAFVSNPVNIEIITAK